MDFLNSHTHVESAHTLTENDFMANETRRLKKLAGLIRLCGRTPVEIAKACNLDRRTVYRALRAEPLRSDAQARIEFYIQQAIICA